jgi:hypothetical protein
MYSPEIYGIMKFIDSLYKHKGLTEQQKSEIKNILGQGYEKFQSAGRR